MRRTDRDGMKRTRLGLIYGGRSGEHEVSLRSARSIADHVDRSAYELVFIGIDRDGHWRMHSEEEFRRIADAPLPQVTAAGGEVTLAPAPTQGAIVRLNRDTAPDPIGVEVVFPIIHGPHGEDGTLQGLLELADVPYIGAGVLGSALGMDKDVQKRLLRDAGMPVVEFRALRRHLWDTDPDGARAGLRGLGLPLFVKPANLGSSVGITKVHRTDELEGAVALAFAYDDKIVVERGIDAREIECAVLGNDEPAVSLPGEVCPAGEYYSYEAKYVDAEGASFKIPAPLSPEQTAEVRDLAGRAFRILECEGMARVDLFLERGTDAVFVNEVNTIPGFTAISQYPRLWEASGLPYGQLIDRLVALALERHRRRRRLQTQYRPALR